MEARKLPDRIGVDEFLTIDQATFGDAWRYELIDGLPVAQAAPSPRHAAIVVNISAALKRLTKPPCRPEAGSAAVPRNKSADRCRDLGNVDGVEEIIAGLDSELALMSLGIALPMAESLVRERRPSRPALPLQFRQ